LVFADGAAAAETFVVLDSRGPQAVGRTAVLAIWGLASALVGWLREGLELLKEWVPSSFLRPSRLVVVGNPLSVATGPLISVTASLSMLAGTLLIASVGPYLIEQGIGRDLVLQNIPDEHRDRCAELIDRGWEDLTPEEKAFVKSNGGRQAAYMQQQ